MIVDSLKNAAASAGLHPGFKMVFDYLNANDLTKAEPGKIVLDGENVFINVVEMQGKTCEAANMETHDDYIDIQILMQGEETFGWMPRTDLKSEKDGGYNAQKDLTLYEDKGKLYFTLSPGEFAIFYPADGHAPGIGNGAIRKYIAKVKVNM